LLVSLQNFIFASMTRRFHFMPLESPEVDANPTFNAVIAYEDFETGKRAKRTYDFLVENLGHDCQFTNQMWKFDVLGIPKLREMAARDAMMSDIVIVSCRGTELPAEFKAWVELWVAEPNHPIALVALFDYLEDHDPQASEVRSYLADVAQRGQMEFFAQPGESPRQRTAEDFRALQRNISFEGQTLSTLAGAMQRDMSFPHWGINE